YFRIAPSAQSVTFRHLLTHTSGFRQIWEGGLNDGYTYGGFKLYFETGVNPADIGQWHYHNGNYVGLRIAMAIMSGEMSRTANCDISGVPGRNDRMWDGISIAKYIAYVQGTVLPPASVTASLTPGDKDGLAYGAAYSVPGWAPDATPGAGTDA